MRKYLQVLETNGAFYEIQESIDSRIPMFKRPSELTTADFPVPRRKLGDFQTVEPLLHLCEGGKLYDVETWISEGRPIQYRPPEDRKLQRRPTALQIAVQQRSHSLAALLLANSYAPNGDSQEPFSSAIRTKDPNMVKLLLDFGADPNSMDFCEALESCNRSIMDLFVDAGVDPCRENAVARSLHFLGRPILGFIKQYRDRFPSLQRQIDIALHAFVAAEQQRGVALMLWLGADPHAKVPSSPYNEISGELVGDSAFETAIWSKDQTILDQLLKMPIPAECTQAILVRASFGSRPELIRRLIEAGANPNTLDDDGYPPLYCFINSMLWRHSVRSTEEIEQGFHAFEILLRAGGKLILDERRMKLLRRELANGESKLVIRMLDLLHKHSAATPEQLRELTRTPAVQRVLNGYTKPNRSFFDLCYSLQSPTSTSTADSRNSCYWKRNWWRR